MSNKRRDNKGRILREGESQRKDGRYEYRYTDSRGNRKSVYSWRLVETDSHPSGKRRRPPLRELENKISEDKMYGVVTAEKGKDTFCYFCEKYIDTNVGIKDTTKIHYNSIYNIYIKKYFENKKIADINYSDIKKYYIHLIRDKNLSKRTVTLINAIIKPAFILALRDNYIKKDPTEGVFREINKAHETKQRRVRALTEEEQNRLIQFVTHSKIYGKYYPVIMTLLGTGMRIGELAGLRWEDCDFENNMINVNHTLVFVSEKGKPQTPVINTPKTKAGERDIPMIPTVREILLKEKKRQLNEGFNPAVVSGYTHFIFSSPFGGLIKGPLLNNAINGIVKAANKEELEACEKEGREPILLPRFRCHSLRHTFCTRFCENETNLKVIQEIMGHKRITTTMDIYNEVTNAKKAESVVNMEKVLKFI